MKFSATSRRAQRLLRIRTNIGPTPGRVAPIENQTRRHSPSPLYWMPRRGVANQAPKRAHTRASYLHDGDWPLEAEPA